MKKVSILLSLMILLTNTFFVVEAKENNNQIIRANYQVKVDDNLYAKYDTSFSYSEEMFLQDASIFSNQLANMGMVLSACAYHVEDLNDVLTKMSFTSTDYYNYERQSTLQDNDFVAYSVSKKDIEDAIVYCVVVRGTPESAEWFSDFNLGTTGNHEGFYKAANEMLFTLNQYFLEDGYEKENRILYVTGHSRGAAVANVVAGLYTDQSYFFDANHIFGYTYACPSVSKYANTSYTNIYNFNNIGDIITQLPNSEWGYQRYGQTITLDLNVYDQVAQQYQELTNKAFTSPKSTDSFFELFSQMIGSEEAYYSKKNQMLVKTLAYLLGGYQSVTFEEFLNDLDVPQAKLVMDHMKADMSPKDFAYLIEMIDSMIVKIKAYVTYTGMNGSFMEQLESLQELSDVFKCAYHLLNSSEVLEAKGVVSAHSPETYVLWTQLQFGNECIQTKSILLGDVNEDGQTNGLDSICLNRYIAGWNEQIDLQAADLNNDGLVNGYDAILLNRYNAGWE